jgi:BASS family bile acid:Na+ symporter
MLSVGMSVTFAQVAATARQVRLVALGIAANFVIVPLVTLGLLVWFQSPALVSAGFLILALCPGAPVAPTFTAIARGEVASSTGLTVILAALSALLAPALLPLLLDPLSPELDLRIEPIAVIKVLLVTQLLPLGVGLAIHERAPRLTARLVEPLRLIGNLLLLGVVALILATHYEMLGVIRLRGWFGILLLQAASLGAGWLCGGPAPATRRSLAVTTGVRNAAVGLVIVSANLAGSPAVTALVAYALVSIFGTLAAAALLGRWTPGPAKAGV